VRRLDQLVLGDILTYERAAKLRPPKDLLLEMIRLCHIADTTYSQAGMQFDQRIHQQYLRRIAEIEVADTVKRKRGGRHAAARPDQSVAPPDGPDEERQPPFIDPPDLEGIHLLPPMCPPDE